MAEIGVVFCTVGNLESAESIAKALVESKLAACVNIIKNLTSVYTWENKLCQEDEILLVIKTRENLFEELKAKIIELHEYSLPEIIFLPVTNGHEPYINWVMNECKTP